MLVYFLVYFYSVRVLFNFFCKLVFNDKCVSRLRIRDNKQSFFLIKFFLIFASSLFSWYFWMWKIYFCPRDKIFSKFKDKILSFCLSKVYFYILILSLTLLFFIILCHFNQHTLTPYTSTLDSHISWSIHPIYMFSIWFCRKFNRESEFI